MKRRRKTTKCDECRLKGLKYCQDCYNFSLFAGVERPLENYIKEMEVEMLEL